MTNVREGQTTDPLWLDVLNSLLKSEKLSRTINIVLNILCMGVQMCVHTLMYVVSTSHT